MSVSAIPLTRIGWKARAAVADTAGRARVLARLSASLYLTTGDQIVWLGPAAGVLHPRAMLTAWPLQDEGETITLDATAVAPWHPPAWTPPADASRLTAAAHTLLAMLRTSRLDTGVPRGLGALLVGDGLPRPTAPLELSTPSVTVAFERTMSVVTAPLERAAPWGITPLERTPAWATAARERRAMPPVSALLDRAAPSVSALARACDADAAHAAVAAAEELIGLGPGLTPAGDDLVGGFLFARRLVGGPAWRGAGATLVAAARGRTHPISLALLSDLAEGHGHEPLHALALALARGEGAAAADAARRLIALGGSSGWDVLAGFLVGLVGSAALAHPVCSTVEQTLSRGGHCPGSS